MPPPPLLFPREFISLPTLVLGGDVHSCVFKLPSLSDIMALKDGSYNLNCNLKAC